MKKKPIIFLHKILENRGIACEFNSYFGYDRAYRILSKSTIPNKKSRDLLISILKGNHPDFKNLTTTEIDIRLNEKIQ